MKISLQELSELTFKRSENEALSDFSLDIKMTNIVWAMDGSRNLAAVARQDKYDLHLLVEQVQQLMKMGLLKVVRNTTEAEKKVEFDDLIQQLSRFIGPFAEIIVEDYVAEMGYSFSSFPDHKFDQLIDRLTNEIQDDESREMFKKRMADKRA